MSYWFLFTYVCRGGWLPAWDTVPRHTHKCFENTNNSMCIVLVHEQYVHILNYNQHTTNKQLCDFDKCLLQRKAHFIINQWIFFHQDLFSGQNLTCNSTIDITGTLIQKQTYWLCSTIDTIQSAVTFGSLDEMVGKSFSHKSLNHLWL